ncbi:MAG: ABC transporter permease [Victivallaceae bacterium]|nr:ABC transporter permease [Victivallaceae bacterium]
MLQKIKNVINLGIKEFRGLVRDPLMLGLIIYSFSVGVYIAATSSPESISNAAIAVVDEDRSHLSGRISDAFFPPMFVAADQISLGEIDPAMNRGDYTFILVIPHNFQKNVFAGNRPVMQLNVDATRMSQAFAGSGYIQQIAMGEISTFLNSTSTNLTPLPAQNVIRNRFNYNLTRSWFGSMVELINNVTMLSIILTGAALIREREHGTLEHLLVMPVTPFEIMVSKVWSMGLVVMTAAVLSLLFIIQGLLRVPVEGSIILFVCGVALHLFACTSMGIFLASSARNMPQFGILLLLVLLPMQMLSGGMTPRESMPQAVQVFMQLAPTTHFVELSQAILYRGAGMNVVWVPFLILSIIGTVLFMLSLAHFRKMVSQVS